jgi:hypothetical protein
VTGIKDAALDLHGTLTTNDIHVKPVCNELLGTTVSTFFYWRTRDNDVPQAIIKIQAMRKIEEAVNAMLAIGDLPIKGIMSRPERKTQSTEALIAYYKLMCKS